MGTTNRLGPLPTKSFYCLGAGRLSKWLFIIELVALILCGTTAAIAFDHAWSSGGMLNAEETRDLLTKEAIPPDSTGTWNRTYAIRGDWDIYLTVGDLSQQILTSLRGKAKILFCVEGEHLYILGPDQKEHDTHIVRTISLNSTPAAEPATSNIRPPQTPAQPNVALQETSSPSRVLQPVLELQPEATGGQVTVPMKPGLLPEGTPLRIKISRTISSADAQVGDNVDFETLDDVKIGGYTVIPKGSVAMATVTEAVSKRRMARGGRLSVNIDYVRMTSGEKLSLRGVQSLKGGGHTGGMTGGMVATAIVFWPAAPFFLFMQGKDVTIQKGHEVTVYTNSDYELPQSKLATVPAVPTPVAVPAVPTPTAVAIPTAVAVPVALPVQRKNAPSPLTNADVLKLKLAGLGDQLIIDKINASPANYRLEVDDLVELKKGGLSEAIISAMIQASQK